MILHLYAIIPYHSKIPIFSFWALVVSHKIRSAECLIIASLLGYINLIGPNWTGPSGKVFKLHNFQLIITAGAPKILKFLFVFGWAVLDTLCQLIHSYYVVVLVFLGLPLCQDMYQVWKKLYLGEHVLPRCLLVVIIHLLTSWGILLHHSGLENYSSALKKEQINLISKGKYNNQHKTQQNKDPFPYP